MKMPVFNCLTIAITIVFCSVTFSLQAQNQVTDNMLKIGDPAPILKTSKWIKGEQISNFEPGKVYVVELWATWCAPCIAGIPHLSELAEKYRDVVTVVGINTMEHDQSTLQKVERFVDSLGNKMDYNVAADDNNYIRDNWLRASGERGIPCAFIIDQNGRLAWVGLPWGKMDNSLSMILDGTWNIEKASEMREEHKRLTVIDNGEVVTRLNPFMGNPGNPVGALDEIEKILSDNPGLRYYPKTGHFTLYSLLKTDPDKAVTFTKEWFAASETPSWNSVTEAVGYMMDKRELPKAMYQLAADSYQAQLDNYPWSMNFPTTYSKIAHLQFKAHDKVKAVEAMQKAIEAAKENPSFPSSEMSKLEEDLIKYKSM